MENLEKARQFARQEGSTSAKDYLKLPFNHIECGPDYCTACTINIRIKLAYLHEKLPKINNFINNRYIYGADPIKQDEFRSELIKIFFNAWDNKMKKINNLIESSKKIGTVISCTFFTT